MATASRLSGTWRGRLIDVQGFEGQIQLHLSDGGDGVKGTFDVEVGGTHAPLVRRGEVYGKGAKDRLQLSLVGKDMPVKVELEGDVLSLRDGGVGLRATYAVSARGFSPLQGGVLCASKDRKDDSDVAERRDR